MLDQFAIDLDQFAVGLQGPADLFDRLDRIVGAREQEEPLESHRIVESPGEQPVGRLHHGEAAPVHGLAAVVLEKGVAGALADRRREGLERRPGIEVDEGVRVRRRKARHQAAERFGLSVGHDQERRALQG